MSAKSNAMRNLEQPSPMTWDEIVQAHRDQTPLKLVSGHGSATVVLLEHPDPARQESVPLVVTGRGSQAATDKTMVWVRLCGDVPRRATGRAGHIMVYVERLRRATSQELLDAGAV